MVKISAKALMKGFYIRSAPSGGYSLAARPHFSKMTSQQKKVRDIALECGIHKGMSKSALMESMQCSKKAWAKR